MLLEMFISDDYFNDNEQDIKLLMKSLYGILLKSNPKTNSEGLKMLEEAQSLSDEI